MYVSNISNWISNINGRKIEKQSKICQFGKNFKTNMKVLCSNWNNQELF